MGQAGKRTGLRLKLAKHLNCQAAHVSFVLKGTSHFSLEHAYQINKFLGHSEMESEYFLNLVSFNRAGSTELKKHYSKGLDNLRDTHLNLSRKVKVKELNSDAQAIYYSHWLYGAIHMLALFQNINTIQDVAERLDISTKKADAVTSFLIDHGILKRDKNGNIQIGEANLHLKEGSPFLTRHQINWRLQSIVNIEKEKNKGDLHYSALYSMSKKDVEIIKDKIIKVINDNLKQIKDSKDEVLFCSVFDFFEI